MTLSLHDIQTLQVIDIFKLHHSQRLLLLLHSNRFSQQSLFVEGINVQKCDSLLKIHTNKIYLSCKLLAKFCSKEKGRWHSFNK